MKVTRLLTLAAFFSAGVTLHAGPPAAAPAGLHAPVKAPEPGSLLLRKGDRLAIVGDSITQQKMYSLLIETYLVACVPQMEVTARQFGWSGETAERFLKRMDNDCLRFKPTVATLCYGMNDYRYRPYDETIAAWYRENYTEVVRKFKAAGARVVVGSPGCVGKVASWVKSATGTVEQHNEHLCALRNIGLDIAASEGVRFADVFMPMIEAGAQAKQRYGGDYAIAGKDGVHPGWAGHLVMAYAFLRALGLDGDIGTLTIDLGAGTAEAGEGHRVLPSGAPDFRFESRRYPFCATGAQDSDNSIRSGMTLVPFNRELNRLTLKVRGAGTGYYRVTWGASTKIYSGAELQAGVNLAGDFEENPFTQPFNRVSEAVLAKQKFETRQIVKGFHGPEAEQDMERVVKATEAERAPLARAIQEALVPVEHTLRIEPVSTGSFYDPVEKNIEGWTVAVDPRLLENANRALADQAFQALANHLQRIKYILEPDIVTELQKLRFWMELDNPGIRAMSYHPGAPWLIEHGQDPRLVKHVHIPRAKGLLSRTSWIKQPYVALHELAHAYHDQVLDFQNPEILAAYQAAKARGHYEPALLYNGEKVNHYGMTNQMEYFAEATEAYVGVNDFYPFVRAELEEHDPAIYAIMERIWGKLP